MTEEQLSDAIKAKEDLTGIKVFTYHPDYHFIPRYEGPFTITKLHDFDEDDSRKHWLEYYDTEEGETISCSFAGNYYLAEEKVIMEMIQEHEYQIEISILETARLYARLAELGNRENIDMYCQNKRRAERKIKNENTN